MVATLLLQADQVAVITVDRVHPLSAFDPTVALGAGVDGHEKGDIARLLSPVNIAAMRSAGLKPLTYRLRTELAGEAWHWNPRGTWSDPSKQQGYWLSSDRPGDAIDVSYGYKLPRRGNTTDQANNDGYSRLDDGDANTFWKSNPYLDGLAQWVVVDLGRKTSVDSLRIQWGEPWAKEITVQLATRDDAETASESVWEDAPLAIHTMARGGDVTIRFADAPTGVRKVRIQLRRSSGLPNAIEQSDPRDAIGFAIREIGLGTTVAGRFRDSVRHAAFHNKQTVTWVSSTDPWHRAVDRDDDTEQPGFDRIFASGLTNSLPMLTPVGILYDTPENAAAEIRYLNARGYPVTEVEMGEEPEEQQVPPEMFGALYRKFVAALRAVDPALRFGGPSLVLLAPDVDEEPSWTKRLMADLRSHDSMFGFFSFEWYPFDDVCDPVAPQLQRASKLLRGSLERLARDGVPRDIPWYMTEYGYSAFSSQAEVDLPGAIFNADIVATFLGFGGTKAFLYGYEPGEPLHEKPCAAAWGNHMMFLEGTPPARLPTYYGAKLLRREWALEAGGLHTLYPTDFDGGYAVARPDGTWAFLLLNKDPVRAVTVSVPLEPGFEIHQYSPAQYEWKANGAKGKPGRNEPPTVRVSQAREIVLPAYSITVAKGSSSAR